jgi:hypothetical protein
MQISFALFADAANLSQEGKLNVLGVFGAVQVAALPAVHPRAHLVVGLRGGRGDAGAHQVTLQWRNPAGTELWSTAGNLDIALPPGDMAELDLPLIASIDLPIDQPGTYTMHVGVDDDLAAEVRLLVRSPATMTRGASMMGSPGLVS